MLAHDRHATLWDAARLLSVGEEGYAYRARVGSAVRSLPELKEISQFFTAELVAQLSDSRSTTTAKLDAPVNKLARLLNSVSIKRILLNDSLRVDFDQVISGREVLVVRGAMGVMGAGNTAVLMQLLVGMLDAALARQQDLVGEAARVAVALKVDEAPLILNRGFAETMALKRSAGLETVACWQTDSQWVDRDVRDQLDALFAHRVYFATASAPDARAAASLTTPEFTDSIRPGMPNLSTLGHPDVRLHLPRHHAIASFLTPAGRQPPFVAETLRLEVDRERLAMHLQRQHERGGRRLEDLRQPHWDRAARKPSVGLSAPAREGEAEHPASAAAREGEATRPASTPPVSYSELADLDRAQSVRRLKVADALHELDPDERDLDMLEIAASLRHILSSQLHRHLNPDRAQTTTQRRVKRLADAGLLERMQFHRRDGGGVPMCLCVSSAGLDLLVARGRLAPAARGSASVDTGSAARRRDEFRQARRDVHAAGWVLAVAAGVGPGARILASPLSGLSPPTRSEPAGAVALSPSDLRLPAGRVPHDFLRTGPSGERAEVQRFETVRPAAMISVAHAASADEARQGQDGGSAAGQPAIGGVAPPSTDLLVEFDDRLPPGSATAKLERYDHFLTGWSLHTRRYGSRAEALPLVVFVCRDRSRAREFARRADAVLGAARAYAGEYPFDWEYTGRRHILFAAERDAHEGLLIAYGCPALPPHVRVRAQRNSSAAAAVPEQRTLLPSQ